MMERPTQSWILAPLGSVLLAAAVLISWFGQGGSKAGTILGFVIAVVAMVVLYRKGAFTRAVAIASVVLVTLGLLAIAISSLSLGVGGRVVAQTDVVSAGIIVQTLAFDTTTLAAFVVATLAFRHLLRVATLMLSLLFIGGEIAARLTNGSVGIMSSALGFFSVILLSALLLFPLRKAELRAQMVAAQAGYLVPSSHVAQEESDKEQQ